MNGIRRTRYRGWFIQSEKCHHLPKELAYTAFASRNPSDDALKAKGDVYFDFAPTENEVIEKLKAELDQVEKNKRHIASISLSFAWYDFWVGWFYDRNNRVLYICLLPMFVIKIALRTHTGGAS